MLCWMNGEFVESEQLMVSPINHGVFYGVNYTEMIRIYNGEAVFLESYYAQLCERLKDYSMTMPYSIVEIREAIDCLCRELKDGICSIHVVATNADIFHATQDYTALRVIILCNLVDPIQFYKEKEALWLQTAYSSDSPSTHIRANRELPDFERYEGFFMTRQGVIAQGITSIIFWAKDDILYTPSLQVGIYPTVPRQLVIKLATAMGYIVQEGAYLSYELEQADECLIVNTLEEIVPISRIGHATFAGQEGLLYERLYHAYGHEILKELRRV